MSTEWAASGAGDWAATYRLQLHEEFTLDAARQVLPYLARLGISHVYLSPCLQASPGSRHGYDMTDPGRISEDLGGESAWERFVESARANKLGILLDIVPNHMAATQHNPWWEQVLGHGPYSEYADFFDIRVPVHQAFRVHVCVLGRPYGEALEAGELRVDLHGGLPRVSHHDSSWPLGPASWGELLCAADGGTADARFCDPCFGELESLLDVRAPCAAQRLRYAELVARAAELLEAARDSGRLRQALRALSEHPARLDAVLRRQFFVLHGWKIAGEVGNYRRFFDVNSLVGVRTELPKVMEATHARIETMITRGQVQGLRVDHPDGLRDPREYFRRLRELLPEGRIYVEKILDNEEKLVEDWPIDGTVGYDFLAKVNRLWMDDQRVDALTATYSDFTGHSVNLARLVREKKRHIAEVTFAADMQRLAALALKCARADWHSRDLSPHHLREALTRLTVALGVYRSYRTAHMLHEQDRRVLTDAVQSARIASPEVDGAAFDFLLALFTQEHLDELQADFVLQWQQLTPAVMAKGVEDTTFYCFDRLVSCNEVGAQASLVGISADRFHEFCHYLGERWPNNLLATSTHDNKRSEDVRARISLLSEIPDRWSEALHAWSQLNAPAWNNRTPDRHAEYLLYQTLIGAWPISQERCWQYMLKACREAKIRTSWHEPNTGYEENIRGFVDGVFRNADFIASLEAFVAPLIEPGRINGLSQTLLKVMLPGVPDFYQGTELWDLSLVDPDNRRPVDFERRAELLERCASLSAGEALRDPDSGLPKLWLIARVLGLRRARPRDFAMDSRYQPLVAQGIHLGNVLAFRRGDNLIAAVPRFTMSVDGAWGDTNLPLPRGDWRHVFTGMSSQGAVTPQELFGEFPVALLVRQEA